MVKIKVVLVKDIVINYTSKGHAIAQNTLCSAISILEYNFFYSIRSLIDERSVKVKIKKGIFVLDVIDDIWQSNHLDSAKKQMTFKILSQSFLIGLSALQQEHPTQIQLNILNKQKK